MTKKYFLSVMMLLLTATGLQAQLCGKNVVKFTFLQVNDVYEIAPLNNGAVGGMARVATLKKQLLAQNPNTYLVLAGDFLSPSVMGTVKIDGKKISGAQMVDCMNAAGMDFVAFGNHEFDIKDAELKDRINESKFTWISTNVSHVTTDGEKESFAKTAGSTREEFPKYILVTAKNKAGKSVKIGILSATLPANKQEFVSYEDFKIAARKTYDEMSPKSDVTLGLTHLSIQEDIELAKMLPKLSLIMGGHEHDNMLVNVGNLRVAKADANAKTAFIHTFTYNTKTKKVTVKSRLQKLDESVALDPEVNKTVAKWTEKSNAAFKAQGFNPDEVVTTLTEVYDGRETEIRNHPTNLGTSITKAMFDATPSCEVAVMNSGGVRIDDQLSGKLTQYDVLRTMPFGGSVYTVEMKGSLLMQILDTGDKNKGSGGYLQVYNASQDPSSKERMVNGAKIDANKTYVVAINDFLMTGKEKNMDFLTETNPGIVKVTKPGESDIRKDIRLTWIQSLKK